MRLWQIKIAFKMTPPPTFWCYISPITKALRAAVQLISWEPSFLYLINASTVHIRIWRKRKGVIEDHTQRVCETVHIFYSEPHWWRADDGQHHLHLQPPFHNCMFFLGWWFWPIRHSVLQVHWKTITILANQGKESTHCATSAPAFAFLGPH